MAKKTNFTNEVSSFHEIDKSRLRIDVTMGCMLAFAALDTIGAASAKIDQEQVAFQCKCGDLFTISLKGIQELPEACAGSHGDVLCPRCGSYNGTARIHLRMNKIAENGVQQLSRILQSARTENRMTLYYYLWHSLRYRSGRLQNVKECCDIIFDMFIKNEIDFLLQKFGKTIYNISAEQHQIKQSLLMLSFLNHLIEAEHIYDLVISIVAIGTGEQRLISPGPPATIQPVGLEISFTEGEDDRLNRRIKGTKDFLSERKMHAIHRVVKLCFNHELRNSFSHSEYRITESGIYLTKYRRSISFAEIMDAFSTAHILLNFLVGFIDQERESFIASGGYAEGEFEIIPVVQGNGMALEIRSPPRISSVAQQKRLPT